MVVRKLVRYMEDRKVLPPNQGGFQAGKSAWENTTTFIYEVYEGLKKLAEAIDLEDAYNRVDCKLLKKLL